MKLSGLNYPLHEKAINEVIFRSELFSGTTYILISGKEISITDSSEAIPTWV
jgi:hypothetical protein